MIEAVVLNKSEIRKIIAAYFGVPVEKVLPSKYSFTVIQDNGKPPEVILKTDTEN